MGFKIQVSADHEPLNSLARTVGKLGESWLPEFYREMVGKTDETFNALARGGTFRGESWGPFKRTPSVKRGGPGALLLQFTGRLRREAAGTIFKQTADEITFGTTLPYARFQQNMRPFLFFEPSIDSNAARDVAAKFLRSAYKDLNQ